MVKRWAIGTVISLAGLASCTIYALSNDVHQQECTYMVDEFRHYDDCEALNDRSDPQFDRCNYWRCGANHFCEIARRDDDRDGVSPALCLPAGEPGDCDDVDPDSRPGAEEICDGRDNDCDGIVDEGMLQVDERVAMTFDQRVSELGFAWNDVTNDVPVVYRGSADDAVGFGIVEGAETAMAQPVWLSASTGVFHASAANVAAVPSGDVVLSVTEAEPTHRIWVGDLIGGVNRSIVAVDEQNLRQTGLRCASDEGCAAMQGPRAELQPDNPQSVPPLGPAPSIPESTRPEFAVLGTQLLVGYARRQVPAADGCEITQPAASLLLNLLEQRVGGYSEITPNAIRLDTSSELRSPRILPIDLALVTGSRGPFGWLVAYLDADGGLVLRRVRPQANDALADLRLRLPPDPAPYLETQIVRGPLEGNRMLIGVAARAGCGDGARVVFGLLQLTWDDASRIELRTYREPQEVGDPGQQASRPVLAYNRELSTWGVAYATPAGLYARVLDRNGQPTGSSAYRLTETLPPVPDMAIVESATDEAGVFTVYTYAEWPDQSPSHVLIERELRTCLKKTTTTLITGN